MATVIRLQRGGRKKRPFYSIVVLDSRKRRDGAFIEKLGYYDPCREPEVIEIDLDRVKDWTAKGAKMSPRVASLVRLASDPEAQAKARAKAEARAASRAAQEAEKAEAAEAPVEEAAAEEAQAEEAQAEEAQAEEAQAEEAQAEEAASAETGEDKADA